MKQYCTSLTAFLLSLAMSFSLLSATAWAEEIPTEEALPQEVSEPVEEETTEEIPQEDYDPIADTLPEAEEPVELPAEEAEQQVDVEPVEETESEVGPVAELPDDLAGFEPNEFMDHAEPIAAYNASTSSYRPYAKIEYGYSGTVSCGTIRYISQVTSDGYFYKNYWPTSSFGAYASPSSECGTASISMALSYIGVDKTPKAILQAYNGVTNFGSWGVATKLSLSASSTSTAVSNYINGNGKYSPPVIHIPGYSSAGHYVVVIGQISSNVYQILDPWARQISSMTISGTSASYTKSGATKYDIINELHQWYNAGASIATAVSKPTFSGINHPTSITQGATFSIQGTVSSSGSNLTNVTVGVYDANNKPQTDNYKSVNPNSSSYNIHNVDNSICFNHLKPGVYRYTVSATNAAGTADASYCFTVLASGRTVADGVFYIIPTYNPKLIIATSNNSKATGANVCLGSYSYKTEYPNRFKIIYRGSGYYEIADCEEKVALDVSNGASANQSNIQLFTRNHSVAQLWQILPNGNGYCFVPKCAVGSCMDITAGNFSNGTNIQLYQVNSTSAQRYCLYANDLSNAKLVNSTTVNNVKYELYSGNYDWYAAKRYAKSKGGRLAELTSETIQTRLAGMVNSFGKSCWIGALGTSGTFKWASGAAMKYTNWYPGEPNCNNGTEFFAGIYKNGTWNDFCLSSPTKDVQGFLVEYPTSRVNLTAYTATLSAVRYIYNGTARTPAVTVTNGTTTLTKAVDYTVSYASNINAGNATVIIKGIGNYSGTIVTGFTITKANQAVTASNQTMTAPSSKALTRLIGAKVKGGAKLTYISNNKSITVDSTGKITIKKGYIGKALITITAAATSNYNSIKKTITVLVNPAGTSVSSIKSVKSKKMTIKWSKKSGITGYQIQYSTDKSFKSGAKLVLVTSYKTTSKTISALVKNRTYYVRIRTYKTVSGIKYYSSWSGIKSVKATK